MQNRFSNSSSSSITAVLVVVIIAQIIKASQSSSSPPTVNHPINITFINTSSSSSHLPPTVNTSSSLSSSMHHHHHYQCHHHHSHQPLSLPLHLAVNRANSLFDKALCTHKFLEGRVPSGDEELRHLSVGSFHDVIHRLNKPEGVAISRNVLLHRPQAAVEANAADPWDRNWGEHWLPESLKPKGQSCLKRNSRFLLRMHCSR